MDTVEIRLMFGCQFSGGVLETRGVADEDEVGGLDRIAIGPSFPYLLYPIFKSSNESPLLDIFSTMFFLRYCG